MLKPTKDYLNQWILPEVQNQLTQKKGVCVSLSGGLDSAVVLLLMTALFPPESIKGLHFHSFFHFDHERQRAIDLCDFCGCEYVEKEGPELTDDQVLMNHPSRCRLCKSHRINWAEQWATQHAYWVVDGTNATDKRDPTRLGNKVLQKATCLISPLALSGLEKNDVRTIAHDLEIPWADEMATACLATRFPRNYRLNGPECDRAQKAELILAQNGVRSRVRVYGHSICLELQSPDQIKDLNFDQLLKLLQPIGYDRVMIDIEGYKSGREWLN